MALFGDIKPLFIFQDMWMFLVVSDGHNYRVLDKPYGVFLQWGYPEMDGLLNGNSR